MDQTCSSHTAKAFIALFLLVCLAGPARAQKPGTSNGPAPAANAAPPANTPATPPAPEPPDKVVLKVGDQQFTKAQIDNMIAHMDPRTQSTLAAKGKKPLADWYKDVVIFSQRAQAHHLDERPDFIYKLAFQKQLMEAQAAAEEISAETKVDAADIQKYYDEHASSYDQITVRQILVRVKPAPPQTPSGSPPPPPTMATGLSPEEAKSRAEAIRKEILAGTDIKKVQEDFKGPGIVVIEDVPRNVRRGSMPADREKVAFALKDGDVSEPMEISSGLLMFQVTAHNHIDLKTATPDIEKTLRPDKVKTAMDAVKNSVPIWMDDQYFAPPPTAPAPPALVAPGANTPPKP